MLTKEEIKAFCKKNHIKKLSFFGSILRDDYKLGSDIDILVEFEPQQRVGMLQMAAMELQLSKLLKREVDIRTPAELSRYFRDEVLANARVEYAEG